MQLDVLNDQLVKSARAVEGAEAECRQLRLDNMSLQHVCQQAQDRLQSSLKRAAAATDANKLLSSRVLAAERERDAMRTQLSAERDRSNGMSDILSHSSISRNRQTTVAAITADDISDDRTNQLLGII